MVGANPFRIAEHVSGEFFTDRAEEVSALRRCMVDPSRVLVHGRRRVGKSSAIAVAAQRVRRRPDRALVVRADLATTSSLFDVSARLLNSLYQETVALRYRFEDVLGELRGLVTLSLDEATGMPTVSFGTTRRTASEEHKRKALLGVFDRLEALRVRAKRPVAVVLDEFQAIHRFGGEVAEWHLRDLIQTHGDLSYVCAGSEESLIRDMVGPSRAFYKFFEMVYIGPLPGEHFARWLEERLKRGRRVEAGVGEEIVRLAGPRTQDAVQLARQLFDGSLSFQRRIGRADVADALDDVVRSEDPIIRTVWSGLSGHQQDVLRVLAKGETRLMASDVRDRYGLPGASSVQRAVQSLVDRDLLVREADGVAFDSPFLRRWVEVKVSRDLG